MKRQFFALISILILSLGCDKEEKLAPVIGPQYIKGYFNGKPFCFSDSSHLYEMRVSSSYTSGQPPHRYSQNFGLNIAIPPDSANNVEFVLSKFTAFRIEFSKFVDNIPPSTESINEMFEPDIYQYQLADVNAETTEGVMVGYTFPKTQSWISDFGDNSDSYFEIIESIDYEEPYSEYSATHKIVHGKLSCNLYYIETGDPTIDSEEFEPVDKAELRDVEFYIKTAVY
ncbi:hypothetical protein [Marinoscillum pacificum]|uniref:hypothetical protein n=1 Tax=Marinoscillum pacificum TaxID=392723 RepID=UPI00215851D1|nr:hypothetical protein [Marinoscillum pacificum]